MTSFNSPSPVQQHYVERRLYYDERIPSYHDHYWNGVPSKVIQPRTVLSSGVTPGYHELLAKGLLVPYTEHHVISEKVENTFSLAQGEYRYGGVCSTGHLLATGSANGQAIGGPSSVWGNFPTPSLDDFGPLLTKALGEANTGALLILLELAESPKTVRLVADAVSNFRKRKQKLLKLLRKKYKTKRTARQTANIFADMWLEYRYGWRQLYFSSRDVATSLDVMSQEQHFVINIGRAFSAKVESGTVYSNISDSWINVQLLGQSCTAELEQRAVVALQIFKALASLDFNLVGLGYELVPYSFVLDWFVNVGDVARAAWPVPHAERCAATSWKRIQKAKVHTRVSSFNCDFGHLEDGLYTHSREEYKRTPFDEEIPIVFNVNPKLGLSRILDLVSLAVGGYNRHDSNSWRNANHLRI
jgi:hypothetical protein